EPRRSRAREHACRLAVALGQRFVVDAVGAQRALGHLLALFVELARAVRTRPRAVLAADALVEVDQHEPVFLALVARAGRTGGYARRVLAVQARFREVDRVGERKFARFIGLHAVEEGAGRIGVVRALIRETACLAGRVPLLAARHAGVAADADVQVDD